MRITGDVRILLLVALALTGLAAWSIERVTPLLAGSAPSWAVLLYGGMIAVSLAPLFVGLAWQQARLRRVLDEAVRAADTAQA